MNKFKKLNRDEMRNIAGGRGPLCPDGEWVNCVINGCTAVDQEDCGCTGEGCTPEQMCECINDTAANPGCFFGPTCP